MGARPLSAPPLSAPDCHPFPSPSLSVQASSMLHAPMHAQMHWCRHSLHACTHSLHAKHTCMHICTLTHFLHTHASAISRHSGITRLSSLPSISLCFSYRKNKLKRTWHHLCHFEWFWWSNDNTINRTDKFVKWNYLGPRDIKSPNKAKHEERTKKR